MSEVGHDKLGKKPVFSVVFALRDGLADLNVWDVKRHSDWLRALNDMVEVEGLTCSRRAIGHEDWAKAPGDLMFHANESKYRIVVNKGTIDISIPMNPDIPPMWFRPKSAQYAPGTHSQQGSAPGTPTRATELLSSQRCCDAPDGLTCKVTGELHVRVSVCATCHMQMNPKQPFCGEQTGSIKCEAVARTSLTSPFTVVENMATARARPRESTPETEDDNHLSKVLKF